MKVRGHHASLSPHAVGFLIAVALLLLAMQFCSPGLGRGARSPWADRSCTERLVDGPSGPVFVGNCD